MNSTDKKLYELFPTEDITLTDEFTWNKMTFKREPELYDVFRVAKEKWWIFVMNNDIDDWLCFANKKFNYDWIHYDATLPLLQQENSTKEQIISLFS